MNDDMKDPLKRQLLSTFDMPCHVCKEPSKSQCPSCRTPYCGKACQRIDWKRGHKKDCKELTLEFKRGYNYVEPMAKKKEAPPVVVIPDIVKTTVDMKHTTNEAQKPADEEAPSGRESCPICLELIPNEPLLRTYKPCCGNTICTECSSKCMEAILVCPLCRAPAPTTNAEMLARLQRRVDKGDPMAQCQIGCAYEHGRFGMKKNMKRAVQFYGLSAAQGHLGAQFNLGLCFYRGRGVKIDKKKALHYFKLVAIQGGAEAQYACGNMYGEGDVGVERDDAEAQRYWDLAAAQGHQGAQNNLEKLARLQSANARR